ncbi:hypothetical protein QNO07_07540 [Streptomyces sp. 549]|nr:hypothetical protein [Streptomyces sp. 549]MDK1473275.1 hypothetical protein [Streptomyces sp. 549]
MADPMEEVPRPQHDRSSRWALIIAALSLVVAIIACVDQVVR